MSGVLTTRPKSPIQAIELSNINIYLNESPLKFVTQWLKRFWYRSFAGSLL